MHRYSRTLSCVALLLATACSNGESPTIEGESVVVAQRGTGFTEERRELDRELGIDTVPLLEVDTSAGGWSSYSGRNARDGATPPDGQQAAIDPAAIDPSTLTVGGVDPSLAARLKADPSAYATTKIENLVTFRMLTLTGIDLDALLDYLFLDVAGTTRRINSTVRDLAFETMRLAIGLDRPKSGSGAAPKHVATGYSARRERDKTLRAHLTDLSSLSKSLRRVQDFTFPAPIEALDQTEAAVVGYMIPLEYKPKTDDIKIFMLVRDLMACCFGGAPRPDEWVYVEMDGDSASKLYPYLPIVVRGKLTVGRLEDEFGLSSGVYSMNAKSVEEFKAE